MDAKTLNFFAELGLTITERQKAALELYVSLVCGKINLLNITAAKNETEIWQRHIADGLSLAHFAGKYFPPAGGTIMDAGAGAGFVGFTLAVLHPDRKIILAESSERKCAFMNWAVGKMRQTGVSNISVLCRRLGERTEPQADFVCERAMGKLEDIKGICLSHTKPGGFFCAFQGAAGAHPDSLEAIGYNLPCDDTRRFLVVFPVSLPTVS